MSDTGLSTSFEYWGKARPKDNGPAFHLLPFHSLDVAAVGQVFLAHNQPVLVWIANELGLRRDLDSVSRWLTFWLALHDLGKFSLRFQAQRLDLVEQLQGAPPPHQGLPSVRHDSLGHQFWLEDVLPVALEETWFQCDNDMGLEEGLSCWARAVMGHHGQPPLNEVPLLGRHFQPRDRQAALAFVVAARQLILTQRAAALPLATGPRFAAVSQILSWWIAGLAVLADWIGSNADIFQYRDQPTATLDDYWPLALQRAELALKHSGVLPVSRQQALDFAQLFPHISKPSPLQTWATSVELSSGPQIHLLEDVTGAGKTEAALMLAHRLMAMGCVDGFFIGLPTMATANAMYERLATLYQRLFAGQASLVLAHAWRDLVDDFAASIVEAGPDESDAAQQDDTATRRCQRWLADHNKRALLSAAGIGTIDQALLGALQSKHQCLRLLGLVRKVLIVDEVHACDAYMQRTLETLLRFHARAGGSAILLSATLSKRTKASLVRAFAQGCGQVNAITLGSENYPLVSSWTASHAVATDETAIATRPEVNRSIRVRYLSEQSEVIQGIVAALQAGQCVAWIRNTVGDALDAMTEMAKHWPADQITLFHARFALGDRLDIEERVLKTFGPDSGPAQRRGQLLIATQVAEQSLDIDFDLVVSDLAPIDRLIQRMGRLRRHIRDTQGQRLPHGALDQRGEPVFWVLGPPWTEAPAPHWFRQTLPKSSRVYANHAEIWLSARALQSGQLRLPQDARALIEAVFGDAADVDVPPGLQRSATEATGQKYTDASQAVMNSVKLAQGYQRAGLDWAADTVAPSRLGEDTVEVLLGRWEGNNLRPWRNDKPRHAWAYSTVRVPRRLIAESALPLLAERQAVFQNTLAALPGGGRGQVLLALDASNSTLQAQALGAANHQHAGLNTTWTYDAALGLRPLPDLQENSV